MLDFTNLRVKKEVADLVCTYCKIYDLSISDFVEEVLKDHLKEFKETLNSVIGGKNE